MSFFVGTKAQAKVVRRALRALAGYPAKGVTVGSCTWTFVPPELELDADGDPLPTPGWTTEAIGEGDEAGAQVALEVPAELEQHLGKSVTVAGKKLDVPARAQLLADESALPEPLRAARQVRREARLDVAMGGLKPKATR